ncbi:MAG: alkylhydroperoxidase [Planctomycetaceae bacterium]|nr:alkylhydroperoxidase [Planctomycetaceae bacterium]|tara:strand:- start:3934 stop:4365 length:432 start_codon:yes stop_codon:yes gene_type:complete
MTTDRIATVQPIEEDLASPRVSAVYDDIKATKNIDFIPNFWKVIAVNVDLLEQVWGQLKTLMHPETVGRTSHLTPAIREMIAVAVSATNGCSYCVNSHTAILKKHGVQDEAIGEVLAIAGLFNQTNSLADGFQIQSDVFPRLD